MRPVPVVPCLQSKSSRLPQRQEMTLRETRTSPNSGCRSPHPPTLWSQLGKAGLFYLDVASARQTLSTCHQSGLGQPQCSAPRHPPPPRSPLASPVGHPGGNPGGGQWLRADYFLPSQSPRSCFVQAQFDFSAQDPSQLSFRRGDIIEVLERPDPHWWRGRACGREGFFPRSYVQPVHL
jgi:hypothetical protein